MKTTLKKLSAVTPLFLAILFFMGCAGYEGSVKDVRSSLRAGDMEKALAMADKSLEVENSEQLPEELEGDNALLLLERATIKQGLTRYRSSSIDFRASDKHLELLDLKNDTMGNIGKYLFSDDATAYKAPAYEKLLVNTLNMLNYLALYNLEEARVEARRLQVMQEYLAGEESEQASLLGLGSYLSGFTFEMSGKAEQALGYYDEALAKESFPSLAQPIRRLAACTSFRTERIDAILAQSPPPTQCAASSPGKGTVLVISGVGLAPHKVARRIPIGAAIVIAGVHMGAVQTQRANELALKGLLSFVNFPTLEKTPELFSGTSVRVGGQAFSPELGIDVTERIIQAWNSIKGKLMVAAIVRMITRFAAGEATSQAVKKAGGGVAGILAGLAVQGAMTAADTPDTRSWVTLPSKIFITRIELPVGQHKVEIIFKGKAGSYVVTETVDVKESGFAVIPVWSMR